MDGIADAGWITLVIGPPPVAESGHNGTDRLDQTLDAVDVAQAHTHLAKGGT